MNNLLLKIMGSLGYVPKKWLEDSNEQRDIARKLLKFNEMNLSKDVVIDKNRLNKWSKTVRDEGNNTCDICKFIPDPNQPKDFSGKSGKVKFLTAHHLYDKNIHSSLMYVPENGVCLCNECHDAFHHKYTSKSHCTPRMYEKFKNLRQGTILLNKGK